MHSLITLCFKVSSRATNKFPNPLVPKIMGGIPNTCISFMLVKRQIYFLKIIFFFYLAGTTIFLSLCFPFHYICINFPFSSQFKSQGHLLHWPNFQKHPILVYKTIKKAHLQNNTLTKTKCAFKRVRATKWPSRLLNALPSWIRYNRLKLKWKTYLKQT